MEQTERRSPNLSRKDRALIFAILYENFVNWNYPHPAIFASWTLRCVAFVSLVLLPTKMEVIAARRLFQARILPSLRRGNLVNVIRCLLGLGLCRMKIIGRLTPAFCQRCFRRVPLLEIQHSDSGVLNR